MRNKLEKEMREKVEKEIKEKLEKQTEIKELTDKIKKFNKQPSY